MDPEVAFQKVCGLLSERDGFECAKFKVGSYNAVAGPSFQLPYDASTLAVLVMNGPSFLETTFKEWLRLQRKEEESFEEFVQRFGSDPLNAYFRQKLDEVRKSFLPAECEAIHDFDFTPERLPKVLMTVCGHVSGAAYFYPAPKEANNNDILLPVDEVSRLPIRRMGLSVHPKFGGYFAFRTVLIFPGIVLPATFVENEPKMTLDTAEKQNEAVELFNNCWRDGRYRDCGCLGERYSELQVKFYSIPPSQRWPLIKHWFS